MTMSIDEYRDVLSRLTGAAGLRCPLVYSYELRDALHHESARCAEEGRPFPEFSKRLLRHVEEGIQAIRAHRLRREHGLAERGQREHGHRERDVQERGLEERGQQKRGASRPTRSRPVTFPTRPTP